MEKGLGFLSSQRQNSSDEQSSTGNFYIMKNEVTQELYTNMMDNNPSYFSDCGNDCPMERVGEIRLSLNWSGLGIYLV